MIERQPSRGPKPAATARRARRAKARTPVRTSYPDLAPGVKRRRGTPENAISSTDVAPVTRSDLFVYQLGPEPDGAPQTRTVLQDGYVYQLGPEPGEGGGH